MRFHVFFQMALSENTLNILIQRGFREYKWLLSVLDKVIIGALQMI